MDRDELAVALVLSVPVAVGVAAGVLKQTLGSKPLLAGATGLTVGAGVFGLIALSVRDQTAPADSTPNRSIWGRLVARTGEAASRDVLLGAGVGAFVTVFIWYIPLSPLLGGATAGFLQGDTTEDARRAGFLSGALVPIVVLLFALVAFGFAGAQVFGRFPFGPGVAAAVSVAGIVYAVGLGTVGGWIGGLALEDEPQYSAEG